MSKPIAFEYLELACYGLTWQQIAWQYKVSVSGVRIVTLRAARIVGRLGFWKFDIANRDELDVMRRRLLANMRDHGLLPERKPS